MFTSPNGGEVWETEGWTKYHRLESTNSSAGGGFAFAFSPDAKWLANSNSTGLISIWDIRNRKLVSTLTDPEQSMLLTLAFSKDQGELRSISGGMQRSFKSWDFAQLGRELQELGIDSPVTTFIREESIASSQSQSESLAEFSVGHNQILDALMAEQLLIDARSAFEDIEWQPAWELYREMLALRLKNFLWKNVTK